MKKENGKIKKIKGKKKGWKIKEREKKSDATIFNKSEKVNRKRKRKEKKKWKREKREGGIKIKVREKTVVCIWELSRRAV